MLFCMRACMRAVSSGTALGFFFNVDNATKFTAEKKRAAPPCYKHAKSLASNHTVMREKKFRKAFPRRRDMAFAPSAAPKKEPDPRSTDFSVKSSKNLL